MRATTCRCSCTPSREFRLMLRRRRSRRLEAWGGPYRAPHASRRRARKSCTAPQHEGERERTLDKAPPPASRLPVTVITGFLGSGKTTLVKHILTNQQGLRTAVIVNDLGDIGIDGELIVSRDDDMVELENGCICCSLNNDFLDTIFRIL